MGYSDYVDKSPAQLMALLAKKLAAKEWQEADMVTRVMLSRKKYDTSPYLDVDAEKLIATEVRRIEIRRIDALWQKYSNNRFGFTVQKSIYKKSQYQQFVVDVGWHNGESWLSYSDILFAADAPKGHLPYCGWHFWQPIYYLSSRNVRTSNSFVSQETDLQSRQKLATDRVSGSEDAAAGQLLGTLANAVPWLLGAAAVAGVGYLLYREFTKEEREEQAKLAKKEEQKDWEWAKFLEQESPQQDEIQEDREWEDKLEREEQERYHRQKRLAEMQMRLENEHIVQKNIGLLLSIVNA